LRTTRVDAPNERAACDHDDPVAVAVKAARSRAPRRASDLAPTRPRAELAAIAVVVGLAVALRLWALAAVPSDPFYDAAVRSMPLSLHNFLLGAYEPGGSLAVDKPPLDLWLQVLTTQLVGFTSFALKLPPALAGAAAVAVLYGAVRRALGGVAGVAAALALAALPIALLTSRSDTMDSVSMLLSVIALWSLVRFAQDGRSRWCYLAAAALVLAFNVKLFEGLVALPALLMLGVLVCRERRAVRLAVSAAVFLAVALSWLMLTLAFPNSDRPFAIGSTNGSAWNAAFVFNGYDRIAGAATQPALTAQLSASQLRPANQSELARSAVPIGAPALLRLFDHDGPLSGLRLGFMLLAALVLGVPALTFSMIRARGPDPSLERAFAGSILLWLITGVVLYSVMARLHPRYTEGFTPAVAAAAGIGAAWLLRDGLWQRVIAIAGALALVLYARHLLGDSASAWRLTAIGGAVAVLALLVPAARVRAGLLAAGIGVAALALPLQVDASLIHNHEFDSGRTGALSETYVRGIGTYIGRHDGNARYEFAAADPTEVGALIIADRRPILSLTSYDAHELLPLARLRSLVATRQLRFAVLDGGCGHGAGARALPGCSLGAVWVRTHGIDVSLRAGLPHQGVLYRLSTR
jgi:4-amino-4-deoxy-L-arabinose transferase-like glycosyltransferase